MTGTVVVAIAPEERAELERALAPATVVFRSAGPDRLLAEAPVDDPASVTRSLRDAGYTTTIGPRSEGARRAWARHLEPVWFGEGRCVCLPWADLDRDGDELVVEIDPGAGFGAGRHPSTAMLLEFLDRHVTSGSTVLDVGCGSGVLAVVAARLGAGRVRAIDVDPAAVAATVANAERNGVADHIEVDDRPMAEVDGDHDLVVANIHAPVLAEMAPDLRRVLADEGLLALSGLSPGQESVLARAIRPLAVVDRRQRDDWVALVAAGVSPPASS